VEYLSTPEPLPPSATLREAVKTALELNEVEVPVAEGRRYFGVVDLRPYVLPTTEIFNAKVSHLMLRYPSIPEKLFTPARGMALMASSGVRGVPVVGKGGSYVGMFYHIDALRYLRSLGFGESVEVRRVMRREVPVVEPGDSIAKAAAVMRRLKSARVVVVEEGRPVGVLTRTDLLRIAFTRERARATRGELSGERRSVLRGRVGEYMSRRLYTVAPSSSLAEAVRIMVERGVRGLPVVNERDELLGLLVSTDVIRLYVSRLGRRGPSRCTIGTNVEGLEDAIREVLASKRIPPGVRVRVEVYRRRGKRYEVNVRFNALNRIVSYTDEAWGVDGALTAVRRGLEKCRARLLGRA